MTTLKGKKSLIPTKENLPTTVAAKKNTLPVPMKESLPTTVAMTLVGLEQTPQTEMVLGRQSKESLMTTKESFPTTVTAKKNTLPVPMKESLPTPVAMTLMGLKVKVPTLFFLTPKKLVRQQ